MAYEYMQKMVEDASIPELMSAIIKKSGCGKSPFVGVEMINLFSKVVMDNTTPDLGYVEKAMDGQNWDITADLIPHHEKTLEEVREKYLKRRIG